MVSYPGYIIKATPSSCIPSRFFIFDAKVKKWMLVTKPHGHSEGTSTSEVEISKDDKVLAPMTTIRSLMALILHRLPFADTDHTYGTMVKLDQLDARDRNYLTLSATH